MLAFKYVHALNNMRNVRIHRYFLRTLHGFVGVRVFVCAYVT